MISSRAGSSPAVTSSARSRPTARVSPRVSIAWWVIANSPVESRRMVFGREGCFDPTHDSTRPIRCQQRCPQRGEVDGAGRGEGVEHVGQGATPAVTVAVDAVLDTAPGADAERRERDAVGASSRRVAGVGPAELAAALTYRFGFQTLVVTGRADRPARPHHCDLRAAPAARAVGLAARACLTPEPARADPVTGSFESAVDAHRSWSVAGPGTTPCRRRAGAPVASAWRIGRSVPNGTGPSESMRHTRLIRPGHAS